MRTLNNLVYALSIFAAACSAVPEHSGYASRIPDEAGIRHPSPGSIIQMPEIEIREATVAPQPKADPALPSNKRITKGVDLVDQAIICPSYDLADYLFRRVNTARHYQVALSPDLRRQVALTRGYDEALEPDVRAYRCAYVPAGTHVTIEPGNLVPVISGSLPNGGRFRGVTLPTMIGS